MVRRALVLLPRCIGDTLLTTPLLRQLKRIHSAVHLHVACSAAARPVVEHNSHIDRLTVLRRGKGGTVDCLRLVGNSWRSRYDLVIDTYSIVKTAIITRLTGARQRTGFERHWPRNRASYTYPLQPEPLQYAATNRLLLLQHDQLDTTDLQLDFPTSRADQLAATAFCRPRFRRPVAAVCPVSTSARKQWPLEKFASLGKRLVEQGFQVLVLHGPGERAVAQRVGSAIGGDCIYDYATLPLPVMKEVLRACTLFVGNDGGLKHIANASGLPTVTVFGEIPAESWTEPGRPDQRFVSPHTSRTVEQHFGEFTSAQGIQQVAVANVWQQVEVLLSEGHLLSPGSMDSALNLEQLPQPLRAAG